MKCPMPECHRPLYRCLNEMWNVICGRRLEGECVQSQRKDHIHSLTGCRGVGRKQNAPSLGHARSSQKLVNRLGKLGAGTCLSDKFWDAAHRDADRAQGESLCLD